MIAPEGQIWVCDVCGTHSSNKEDLRTTCQANAVLYPHDMVKAEGRAVIERRTSGRS